METVRLNVQKMTCNHCVMAVKKSLESVEGRMFKPLAYTKNLSMLVAAVLAHLPAEQAAQLLAALSESTQLDVLRRQRVGAAEVAPERQADHVGGRAGHGEIFPVLLQTELCADDALYLFGDEAHVGRPQPLGYLHDGLRDRHFKIHAGLQRPHQNLQITLLDMPTVFAQMNRDAVGARLLRQGSRQDGVGIDRATRLSQGGNMVDVNAQCYCRCH